METWAASSVSSALRNAIPFDPLTVENDQGFARRCLSSGEPESNRISKPQM
jgi:hypothetical protein